APLERGREGAGAPGFVPDAGKAGAVGQDLRLVPELPGHVMTPVSLGSAEPVRPFQGRSAPAARTFQQDARFFSAGWRLPITAPVARVLNHVEEVQARQLPSPSETSGHGPPHGR